MQDWQRRHALQETCLHTAACRTCNADLCWGHALQYISFHTDARRFGGASLCWGHVLQEISFHTAACGTGSVDLRCGRTLQDKVSHSCMHDWKRGPVVGSCTADSKLPRACMQDSQRGPVLGSCAIARKLPKLHDAAWACAAIMCWKDTLAYSCAQDWQWGLCGALLSSLGVAHRIRQARKFWIAVILLLCYLQHQSTSLGPSAGQFT
jgi:hypothetical protein